jgi:hypothetical protein
MSEIEKQLKKKVEGNAMAQLNIKDLMETFNKTLRALQGPATSLQQINIPQTPQLGNDQDGKNPRPRQIKNVAGDPEKLAKLRERANKYLEENGG